MSAPFAGRRVAFLSHSYFSLHGFRLGLMQRLLREGADVYAIAPPIPSRDVFADHGVRFAPLPMRGATIHPPGDARSITRLRRMLRQLRIDVLQTYGLKANVVGALAGRQAGTPVISAVTGLGSLYIDEAGPVARTLARGVDQLSRRALAQVPTVVFQNPDDLQEGLRRGICSDRQARLILSSGIDLEEFSPAAVPRDRRAELRREWGIDPHAVVVVMVARLLPSKGVHEFVAAARALGDRARFVLIGPTVPPRIGSRAAITDAQVADWHDEGVVVATGTQENMVEWLAAADIFTLPSYYREGVPRSNLEAMAMRLPVVTTDTPGCRETVLDGENGYLVPPRDVDALTSALQRLVADPALRERMGERGRRLAGERFSSDGVVEQYVDLYRALLNGSGPQTG